MHNAGASALLERLLEANRRSVAGRAPALGDPVPSEHLVVLTCMDVRIDPLQIFGLRLGQAHVLRNAGARVTEDVIRSVAISQQALGTDTIIVMPHTTCGVLGLRSEDIKPRTADAPPLDVLAIQDIERSLAEDLHRLRQSPWVAAETTLLGLVLDIETGTTVRPRCG